MTFSDYQELAARTINRDLEDFDILWHGLFCLASEVGEVHGLFQKKYQGHTIETEHLKKEIGDCLWALAEICSACYLDLEEVAKINIEKLKARYPEGFSAEKSLNRKEGDI